MKNLQIVSVFPLKKPVIKRTHKGKAHQDKTWQIKSFPPR